MLTPCPYGPIIYSYSNTELWVDLAWSPLPIFFFFFFFKAALKLDDDEKTPAPPLFQENVFIESSRPKYLEDLHTEALQGLKMMQEEGIKPTTDIPSTCLFFPRFWHLIKKSHYQSKNVLVFSETNNGVEYQDSVSTIVSYTLYTDSCAF